MNKKNHYVYDAIGRVLQYNADHPLSPANARADQLFTDLEGVRTRMAAHHAAQVTGRTGYRGGASFRRQAVNAVYAEMQILNRIARGLDPVAFPALREQFRMPKPRTFANILATARTFVSNATPIESIFTERGLTSGFLTGFSTLVTAAEAAVEGKNTGIINQAGATAGLDAAARDGRIILRELDVIISTIRRNDPVLLAAWKTASRIARRSPAPAETPAPGGNEGDGGGDGNGGSTPPAGS